MYVSVCRCGNLTFPDVSIPDMVRWENKVASILRGCLHRHSLLTAVVTWKSLNLCTSVVASSDKREMQFGERCCFRSHFCTLLNGFSVASKI